MLTKKETRILSVISFVLLLILLIPLFSLSKYIAPVADDYSYSIETHDTWLQTHNLAETAKRAAEKSAEIYNSWQGTYSALFLMAMQPGIFGRSAYAVTPFIMILSLILGIYCAVHAFGKHLADLEFSERFFLGNILSILCVQFIPDPVDTFYWYNGAIFYTFFFAVFLIYTSLLVCYVFRKKRLFPNILYYIFLPLLAVFLAGGNYATCLMLAIVSVLSVVWQRKKKENLIFLAILAALYFAFFIVNLKAPGNSARQSQGGGLITAVVSGVKACIKSLASIANWTNLPILCSMVFVALLGINVSENSRFSFRLPWLVAVSSFFFFASGFMPTLYTQDYTGPVRLLAIQYYLFILLLAANVFYLGGWFGKQIRKNTRYEITEKKKTALKIGFLALFLCVCLGSYAQFSAYKACDTILSGEAQGFREETENLWAQYENPDIKDVHVPAFEHLPEMIADPTTFNGDPESWQNQVASYYFYKDSVQIGGN